MMIRRLTVAAGLVALFAACDNQPTGVPLEQDAAPLFSTSSSAMNKQLATVRAATARFHDVNVAIQEGYRPISECISHPQLGGMGIHYARPDLMEDADYIPTEPEMLLYVPRNDGSLKLIGVEYWILEHAWKAAGKSGVPTFLDHEFDYMPAGHRPANYSLHVWVWQANPSGIFEPFNPRVSCP
jgi:hypothetical protein